MPTTRFVVASLSIIASGPAWAQASAPAPPAKPVSLETEDPEGFGDLVKPRDTTLNLYLDGKLLGEVPVELKPDTARFTDLARLIPLLPTLRDIAAVTTVLRQPMATNARLSCSPAPVAGCGRLNPEIAGIIVSRDAGRIDLFLGNAVRGPPRITLADPPPGPPTLAGALGLQYGLSRNGIDFTLQPRLLLGLGRSHIAVEATASNRQASLDRAYFRNVGNRTAFSAGLIQASSFSFVFFDRLLGISFASSNETRVERGGIGDTPLILDTPLQGRVEILRDGVLLERQRVLPGRVTLDTSTLPGGAYPLTLKIIDASGERTETRFFARAPDLPEYGQINFFAEAGWNTAFRGTEDRFLPGLLSPTARAGINYRAGATLGLSARAELSENRQLVEAGLTWLGNGARVATTIGASSSGDWAAAINASGRLLTLNWTLDARKVSSTETFIRGLDRETGLGRSFQQVSAFFGHNGRNFSLNSGLIWRRDPPGRSTLTVLPSARWTLMQKQGRRLELETSGSYSQSSWSLRVGLRLSLNKGRSGKTFSLGTESRHRDGRTRFRPIGSADWSNSRDTGIGPLQLRAGISQQTERRSARLGANLTTTYAQVSADAQIEERLSSNSLYGRIETSFGFAGKSLAFGSGGYSGSGIIAQASGAAGDARFTVRAFGSNARPIRGAGAVFVPTPAFSQGEIGLNAAGGSARLDTHSELAVFYPGTVRKLARRATQVIAAFARLVDEVGKPLAGAVIESAGNSAETDADGRFQIEMQPGGVLDVTRSDASTCALPVPVHQGEPLFLDLGVLTCARNPAAK